MGRIRRSQIIHDHLLSPISTRTTHGLQLTQQLSRCAELNTALLEIQNRTQAVVTAHDGLRVELARLNAINAVNEIELATGDQDRDSNDLMRGKTGKLELDLILNAGLKYRIVEMETRVKMVQNVIMLLIAESGVGWYDGDIEMTEREVEENEVENDGKKRKKAVGRLMKDGMGGQ